MFPNFSESNEHLHKVPKIQNSSPPEYAFSSKDRPNNQEEKAQAQYQSYNNYHKEYINNNFIFLHNENIYLKHNKKSK